jgi:3-dehydroquinate synthase
MNIPPLYHTDIDADVKSAISSQSYSSIHILADMNTSELCLMLLPESLKSRATVIVMEDGEKGKSLRSAEKIWSALLDAEADRDALLVNVGGGVVCDTGSYAASTFKRGISYINIPTSLLAMVDASIGGKTALNFGGVKNVIGTFAMPDAIILFPTFLNTLAEQEIRSGFAEMLKYGLIADRNLWQELKEVNYKEIKRTPALIERCIRIKHAIVGQDPTEKGVRRLLNFGHTAGHAFEGFSHHSESPLSHGEAVAAGMLVGAYLSHVINGMPHADLEEIQSVILDHYPAYKITEDDYPAILQFMRQDKKNSRGNFRYVLLDRIGRAVYDVPCAEREVITGLDYYRSLV